MREEPKTSFGTWHNRSRGERKSAHAPEAERPFTSSRDEAGEAPPRRSRRTKQRRPTVEEQPQGEEGDNSTLKLPFDPLRLLDALRNKWQWWVLPGLILGLLGLLISLLDSRSMASLELMKRDMPVMFRASETGDSFKPQQFSEQTLQALMRSPEVIRRVSAKSQVPPAELAASMVVKPEQDTSLVNLQLTARKSRQETVNLLNLYATEFVAFTQELQAREAREIGKYLGEKLDSLEKELGEVTTEMSKIAPESKFTSVDKQTETYLVQLSDLEMKQEMARIDLETLDYKINALKGELVVRNPVSEKLQAAKDELAAMLVRYTELHPLVKDQQAKIQALEAQLSNATTTAKVPKFTGSATSDNIYMNIVTLETQKQTLGKQLEQFQSLRGRITEKLQGLSEKNLGYAKVKNRFSSLELMRTTLASRQREAQLFEENALGYYRVFTPAAMDRSAVKSRLKKGLVLCAGGALFGMVFAAGLLLVSEILDNRIHTAADLQRITELQVLATLGDLGKMDSSAQSRWAFRAWTLIKGKLHSRPNKGLVCGFISAHHGEGRSTWINLLVNTANQRGLRVLTVATTPMPDLVVHPHEPGDDNRDAIMTTTLSPNVLAFPAQVTQQLNSSDCKEIVHIPLPGWVWNLERRTQWEEALSHWRKIDNLVLLVELPPASEPEAVLLAENIPYLIWLSDSGKVTNAETKMHLETLRHAGCNLVGTVLNHEPESFVRKTLSRWFTIALLGLACSLTSVQAQSPPAAAGITAAPGAPSEPSLTNLSLFVTSSSYRAPWQKRLTLGPGDVINLGFYGETNWTKNDVTIGLDGRVSYLQASDVVATGLTIDELRAKLDQELGRFYRTPRTMITPVSFNSKRYYVMGKVVSQGSYSLDRPISLLEAVARARGLETGMLDRNTVDLADLQRSFLIRQGQHLPVNFEKLFQEGDLSQNIPLEPNDFLYFPGANLQEIYVLGEVNNPGVLAFHAANSAIAAISGRGGFAPKAYKSRVLVIRGSLNKPETFVVDSDAILYGRNPDFKLKPKDILYVSKRPWHYAEDLLDIAITAFAQGAVTAYAGDRVGPFITKPVF